MTDIVPENLLKEINLLAHTGGVPEFARDRLKALHKAVREAAAEIERLRSSNETLDVMAGVGFDSHMEKGGEIERLRAALQYAVERFAAEGLHDQAEACRRMLNEQKGSQG